MPSLFGSIGTSANNNNGISGCLIWALAVAFIPHIRPATATPPAGAAATDTSYLARTIHDRLAADRTVSASGLQVETRDGEVFLRGYVPSIPARQAAGRNIQNMIGVRRVVNLLQVVPDTIQLPAGDLELRLETALVANPYVPLNGVSVSVNEGRVVLSGVVTSVFEREQAERTALSVAGVTEVINQLVVQESVPAPGSTIPVIVSSDPVVKAMLDSIYLAQGIDPDLAFRINANMAEFWPDSLEAWSDSSIQALPLTNPETGYFEYFNFLGLGITVGKYLIKKVFGKDDD